MSIIYILYKHFFHTTMETITNQINSLHMTSLPCSEVCESQVYMININQYPLKISLLHFLMQHFHYIQLLAPTFPSTPFHQDCLPTPQTASLCFRTSGSNIPSLPYFAQFRDCTGNVATVTCASRFGTALN